jgi:hypothetical protein
MMNPLSVESQLRFRFFSLSISLWLLFAVTPVSGELERQGTGLDPIEVLNGKAEMSDLPRAQGSTLSPFT